MPSLSDVIKLLQELQYDESVIQLRNISHVDRKYIPQPWLTLYSILANSLTGRETGHEHPTLETMQIFWGVVKQAQINYAQLIWVDMVNHARQFLKSSTSIIPFYRFTKCLIAHFIEKYPDIDCRSEDKKLTPSVDHKYSKTRIQKTNTQVQGMRIPDNMIPDDVRDTEAYILYDEAQKIGKVGLTQTKKRRTSKKQTSTASTIKTIPKSRTKKVTRELKKKVTNLQDEPTDDEGDAQRETETEKLAKTSSKKADKGKALITQEESVTSPMSESEEDEQMQLTLRMFMSSFSAR
jgi:hypothetical protein